MVLLSLLVLAGVAGAYAGPVSYTSETCATTCEAKKHNFEPGQTYNYDLRTTVTTSIPGGTEDQSSLQLIGLAHIDALSNCELALRLREVVMQEGDRPVDRSSQMKQGLEQNVLRFSLADGLVTGVCPEASEPTWSLNIKRAILSSLQNSMPDFQELHSTTETDVIGQCPVSYEPIGTSQNGHTVRKVKDVSTCSQPMQANTVFQTMSYDVPSKAKSLPLLKSTHECEQELSADGLVMKSVCTERHIFRPFSRGDSGATTHVVQSLNFKSQTPLATAINQPVSLRTDLQYEHVEDNDAQDNTQTETVATLQKICEMTQDGVGPETPGLFLDLVKGMRQADLNTLVSIGRQAKRLCNKAESLYHDAVPTLGTSAGVALMRNMIRGGEVSKDESDMWLSSLAFIPKPDVLMLREVKPLLTMESIRNKAFLAVSSLVNTYCRQNENCENDVREIVTIFKNNLGTDCRGDRSIVLMSLKALGNTGQVGEVLDVLNRCIVNDGITIDVRIAAINALRRMNCNADKTGLLELLQSTYTDAELRINAYIILMKCPSEELIDKVQQLLDSEEINQVGSFIWTHLTNLMESSSPLKKKIQSILEDVKLKKAFDLDKRKYSRNIEWSAFSEAINAGVAVDSNLIWSSQSFVPRSGMVNLTIDLFGQSVNLVELGGRVQGLDAVLEDMFGDKKEGSAMTNDVVDDFDSTYRQPKTEPRGSYYVRIFGNEIRYDDFSGFEMEGMKEKLNYLQWLIELAKEHDIDFSKSMVFLESDLKVPTVSGMPLVLSVDGTATMDLKIKGKMDLRSLLSSPSELDITGTVRPSAAIEIKSRMGVDAFIAKTGLKMVNTFHTSTLADGLIKLKDGKVFNMDINMPRERMDIFNAQSKFYITYKGEDLEQRMGPEDRLDINRCFSGSLIPALGVELCADLSVPSPTKSSGPWFPLSGPATAALSLNKRDSFTKYHMEGRVVQQMVRPGVFNHEIVFAFNTPGSIYDRDFLASFVLNKQEKAVEIDLRSPWKKLGLTGKLINQENLKQMTGQLSVDDAVQYALTTEVQINQGRYAMRYTPKLELVLPGRAPLKVSGSAIYREDKKFDVDISVENVFEDPAIFKGLIRKIKENKKTRVETDMEVRVNSFKGQMSGFVDHLHTKDEIKTDTELTLRYRTDSGPQFFSLANQFHLETPAIRKSLLLAGSVSSSMYSRLDTDFSVNMVSEGNEALMSLNMGLTNNKPVRITLDAQGKMDVTRYYRSAVIQGLARMNVVGNEYEVTLDHKHNPNELQTSATGRVGTQKGTVDVSLKRHSVRPLNVAANAKITYLEHEITYSQTLVEQGNAYRHQININADQNQILSLTTSCKTGQRYEVTTDITWKSMHPVKIAGVLKPDVADFLADAKFVYGSKSYSTDLQWQHNGGYRNFANKGLLNLEMNGDKLQLQSDVSLENMKIIKVNIEGELDIHKQDTRKVGISGNCVLSRTTPSFHTRVEWWPNNFLDGELDMKLDNNGLSSSTRKMEGTFSFQSSFSENIRASFKHDRVPDKVTTAGAISWAPTRNVDVAFGLQKNNGWSDAEVNLMLNTPFSKAKKLSSNIAYRLNGNQLTTNGQVGLNNKLTKFEFSGTADWENSAVDLKATTPVEGYESIALIIKNNLNGRLYASVLKLDVNSRRIFGLEFNMEHERRGYFITNSGSFSLDLPIRLYQTNKLTWSHDNNARNFNSRVVIEARKEKMVFDFELKNRKAFSVKTKLLTPFIHDMYLSLEHQGDRREHIYKTMATAQYGDDTITLENDLSWLSKIFMLKTKLTTPFVGYEEVILDISNVLETEKFEGNFQLKMGAGIEYRLTGTFINNGLPAMTVDVVANCPHTGEISLSIANEKHGRVWESRANLMYLQEQNVIIVGRLGWNNLKKLSIDITSPFKVMEKSSVDIEFQGSPKQFHSKVMLSHNMLKDVLEISLQTDLIDLTDLSLVLAAKVPVTQISFVNIVFRHKFDKDVYETQASLTLPGKQITASNALQVTSLKALNNLAQFQYGDDNIDVELQFNAEKDIFFSMKTQNPWTGPHMATFKQQGTWDNFKTSLSASLNPSDVIRGEMQFFLNGQNVDAMLKITTPFHQLQMFETIFNHHGTITAFENTLKVNYNSKMVLGRIRSDITNAHDMKIEFTAETPLMAYKNILCELKHKLTGQMYQTNLNFISPTQELVATHSLELQSKKLFTSKASLKHQRDTQFEVELKVDLGESVAIDALLRTPWTGQQMASVMHQGTSNNFQTSVNIKPSEDDSVVGHVQFAFTDNTINSLARITTSYPELQNFEVAFTHLGSVYSFETEGKVDLNGESKTAKLVVDLKNMDDITLKLTATTPIHGLDVINMSFIHKLAEDNYQTDLASQIGFHKMVASNVLRFQSFKVFSTKTAVKYQEKTMVELELNANLRNVDDMTMKLYGTTPINGLEVISLSFVHKHTADNYQTELASQIGSQKMEAANMLGFTSFKVFSIKTTVNYREETMVELELNTDLKNVNNMALKLTGTTTINGLEAISLSFIHKHTADNYQTELASQIGSQKMEAANMLRFTSFKVFSIKTTVSYREETMAELELNTDLKNVDEMALKLTGTTTVDGLEVISLSFIHKHTADNYQTELASQIGSQKMEAANMLRFTSFKVFSTKTTLNFQEEAMVELELQTDLKNVDDMALKLTGTSSINGLNIIDMSFIHKHADDHYQTDLASQIGSQKMAASNALQFLSFKVFSTKTAVKHNEETIAEMDLSFDVVQNIAINGVFHSQWTGTQMASLVHKGGWRNFESTVKISPRQREMIIFIGKSSLEGYTFTGQAKLTTPYSIVEIVEVNMNHQGTLKTFTNNAMVNLNGKKMEGQLSVNVADVNDLKMRLIAKSPFSGLERINSHFTHKFTGQTFQSELAAEVPTMKVAAANMLEIRNKANFEMKTRLTWKETETIAIDLSVHTKESIAVHGQFQSPWTGKQTLNLAHQGNLNNFQSMINISPQEGDEIVGQAEFSLSGRQLYSQAMITTPYHELSVLEATLQHQGSVKAFTTELTMNLNGKISTAKLDVNLENLNEMVVKCAAKTPFIGFKKTEVVLSHKMADQTFQSELKAEVGGYKATASNLLQVASSKAFNCKTAVTFQDESLVALDLNVNMVRSIAFDASLLSKWTGKHTISLLHVGAGRTFETTINVSPHQGEMVHFNSKVSLSGDDCNALVKITTPYRHMQSFKVVISHKGQAQKFASSIMIDYNSRQLEGDITVNSANTNNMEIIVTGKTPITGFESIKGMFQHQLTRSIYKTEMTLDTPVATVEASNTVEMRSRTSFNTKTSLNWMKETIADMELDVAINRNIALSGKLKSTWTGTQMATLTHQGPLNNFETSVAISPRESENIAAAVKFTQSGNRLGGTVRLATPYAQLEEFEVRLDHQGSFAKFDSECHLDLNSQKNTVKLSVDFTNLNHVSLKASSLTSLDGFRKTEVGLTHRSSGSSYQSDLTLGLDSQTYEASNTISLRSMKVFSMNTFLKNQEQTMAELQVNLDAVNQIDFDAVFKTQWSGEQMVSLRHEGRWKNFETMVKLSPKQGDFLTLNAQASLQGHKFNGLTRLTTPYTMLKMAEIALNHEGRMQQFSNSLTLKFNEETVEGDFSSDLTNKDDLKMELTGRTTFAGFETIRGLIQHKFTGRVCKTGLLLEAPSMKVAASNMIQIRSSAAFKTMTSLNWMFDNTFDIDLDVDVESDVAIIAKLKSSWTGTQMVSLTHQGQWNNFQTNVIVSPKETETVSASIQVSQDGNSLSGLFKILTPYSDMKNLEVTMTHQGLFRKFSTNAAVKFNDENMEGELSADLTNLKDVKIQLTGRTSLGGLETINGHFTHKITEGHCTTGFILEIPSNKIAAQNSVEFKDAHFILKTSMEWLEKKTEMSLIIKVDNAVSLHAAISSPYINDKSINFNAQGEWRNFEATVKVSLRPYNDIETNVKFSMLDEIEASVSIVSSYSDWKLSRFSFRHTGTLWKFISEMDMVYNGREGKGNLSVDLFNCDDLKITASMDTPLNGLEHLTVDLKHKQTTHSCQTDLKLELSNSKLLASNVINLSNSRVVSTETSLECSFFEKIQLTMNIDMEDGVSIGVVFSSPWSGERRLNLVHQGSWKKFNSQFSIASPSSQTAKFNIEFSIESYSFNGKVQLETVFPVLRQLELSLAHRGDISNFENELFMKYNNNTATGASRFNLDTAGFDGSLEIVTSCASLRQVSVTASHKVDLTAFNSKYELDYMSQKTVLTGVYNRGSLVTGKFELKSPYDVIKTAGIEFSHRGDLTAFLNNGKVYLNERQYSAESTFSYVGTTINYALALHLDHDYSIDLHHDGVLQHFGNNVTVQLDDKVIMARSNFVMTEGNIQTSVALQTPFAGWRDMGLSFKHGGHLMNFQCDLNMNVGDKVITANHIWKFEDKAVLHSLTINTPIQGYSDLKYKLGHQERRGMIKQNLLLSIEDSKLELKTTLKKTTNKMTGNVNLRTPFTIARKVSVTFLHKVTDIYNFNNEVTASLNGQTIAFKSSCSKNNNMVEAAFNVNTPFQMLSRVNGLLKHTGPLNGFSNEATLTYDDTTLTAGTSFRLQGDAMSADVSIETPYYAARRMKLQVAHYGSGLNFKNNMTGMYNNYNIASMTSVMMDNGEIKVTGRLQTPFNGYKNLASGIHLRKEAGMMNSEIFFESGRKRIVVRQRLVLRDSQCEGSVALETPFGGYRSMGIRLKHIGSARNFNSEVTAYIEGKKLQGKTLFKILGSKVDLKLSLETPLQSVTKAGVTLQHDGYLQNFYNVISLNLGDQTVDSTSYLSVEGDRIAANFTLQTPFSILRTLKYQLSHTGNLKNFDNEMSATYNTYTVRNTNKFMLKMNGIEASINVQTSFDGYNSMSLSLLHEGQLLPSKSRCVLKLEDRTMSLTHRITLSDGLFEDSLLIETPFPGHERMGYTVNHVGGATSFKEEFQVFAATSSVQGICKFALTTSDVDFVTTMETPFKGFTTLGMIFKQNGFSRNFNNKFKMYVENSVFTSVNGLQFDEHSISADLKIETPFEGFNSMGVFFKQNGFSKNFNNEVKMYIENNVITSVNSLKFEENTISADFKIETPFKGLSAMGMMLKQQGMSRNFNNEVKLYIENSAVTSVNSLKFEEDLVSADFKIETPFQGFSAMGLMLKQQGLSKNFENEIKIYIENNAITSINSLQFGESTISANFKIDTPFEGLATMGITLKQEGLSRTFSNEVKMYLEDKAIISTNNLALEGRLISADFKITTPFEGFTAMGVVLKQRGLSRNFNNEVRLYIGDKAITSINHLELEGRIFSADFKIETPFEAAHLLAFKLTHSGHLKNFKNYMMAKYNNFKLESRNFFVLYRQKMEANVAVNTSFKGFRNLGLSIKRNGLASDFNIEVSANKEETAINGQLTSKLTSTTYMMNSTLTGPFGNVAANINHEGRWTNFKNEGSLQYNLNEYRIKTEFHTQGYTVRLSTSLNLPQTYGIAFEHSGPWSRFDNKLHLTLADEPHVATSSFKYDGNVEANLKVESSKLPVIFTFKHGGQLKNFKQSSSLSVVGLTYGHTCEMAIQGRKINGLFNLNTSHRQLQTMSVTLNHQGRWTNFENQATLGLNGDTYSANSQLLVGSKRVKGGIVFRIPEEYSLEIIQKGTKTDMTANVKLVTANKKSHMTTEFKAKDGIVDGSVDLRSPYIGGSINSAANFNRNLGSLTASLKTPFADYSQFSAVVSHQGTINDFKSAAKFETPFIACRDISLEVNHKGHHFHFATSGFLEIDMKRLAGDITFRKNRQNVQAAINIRTPSSPLESAGLRLNHRGIPREFNTDAVVQWNDQKMDGALQFKMEETIQANAKLTTPFEIVKQATVNFNHQGSLDDFTTSSDISLNGQTVTGTMSLNRQGTVVESTGSLTTPFPQMRQGSYQLNHRGYIDDFVTSGTIKFDDQVIKAEVLNKLTPDIITTAHLSTPWTPLRQVKFNLNHRGHAMDFATMASGELNGQVINGNLAFKKLDDKLESSVSVQTPFERFSEFAYTYTHNTVEQGIKATGTLTLPGKVYKKFGVEVDFTGTVQNFRTTLKVNTPFEPVPEAILVVSHMGNLEAFTCGCVLVVPNEGIEGEITLQKAKKRQMTRVKITSPYRNLRDLYFEARNEKKGPEIVTHIEATYNGEKHFDTDFTINTGDLTYASFNLHAPVTVEIKGRNKQRSKEMTFNIPSVISLTTSYQKEKGKITQATNLQLGTDTRNKFAYTVEGFATFTDSQGLYRGKLNLNSRHGSFKSSLKHVANHESHQYVTEVRLQQLQLNSDITLQNSLKSVFKVSHPSLSKDIVLGMEGSMIDAYRCKLNLEYDDQKFEFIGKLADQSPSHTDSKYIAEAHLTHPASHLDVQFSSQVTNNVEKMGGNMEVKYMMSRNRQLRTNALRAEINKIRDELNLEVDTPVKRVSMSGRRLAAGNGRHFAVSGTVDDRDLSADLQLTSDVPGFDVSLQLDSENVILVSGKYEEPSSLHLEAFREESGRRIRESEMSLKLSSDNLLSAKFFLNPNIYNDMKRLFGVDLGLKKMLNDVWQSLDEEFKSKKVHLARALQPLKSLWSELTEPIATLAVEMYDRNDYYVRDVVDRVHYWSTVVNDQLASLQYQYSQNFARKYDAMKVMYYKSLDKVQYFADNVVTPYAATAYVKVMKTLDYIHSHPALESALNWLKSIDIVKHYSNFKYYVVDVIVRYNAILDRIDDYWNNFNNIPGMSLVVQSVKGYVNAVRWVYDVTELDQFVQALMNELRSQGWNAIVNWWHSRCEVVRPQVTQYNPEDGEYEVKMKMPVSWTEVTGLPDLEIFKYWDKIKKVVSRNIPDFKKYDISIANNWTFWDIFYAYRPSNNPLDWIPPFKSHATVAGAQHIMTFDKRFYDFIGECTYLLARDFIDGKFSVLINYANVNGTMTKKSITVHSGDKQLEILSNFKVKVDGRMAELPVVYKNTVIRRLGNVIQLDNDHGLTVTCDLPHDRCTVKVTGWYFGKTGGLLGTYDNEPATDFHTADRRHSKSLEDFTLSWSAGSRCRAVNSATMVEPTTSSPEYQMCAKYFEKQTSPLRICFGHMKPSSFMKMCMNEVARSTDKKAAVCRIASFYVEECNMGYVPLRLPKDCVTCSTPTGAAMKEGETVTITKSDVPKAADVIFVVSHKSCNSDVTGKLGSIAQKLTRSFRQSGISDVRFGLVGYGLPGVLNEPHSHTIDGEIFNAGNKFKAAMDHFPTTDEATEEDSLSAIHFATNYPFRTGASKSIILVPCDSCKEQEMTYPEIQHQLEYHNIHLHLLLNHTFKLLTSATKTAYIFGVDNNGLFTPRSVNDEALTGDQALRRQVSVPKDMCTALTQESDGSIFSITQLLQSRTTMQKKFADVFTRLVAKKGAPSNCQICECVADPTGVGMNVCRSCAPVNKPWVEDQEKEELVVQKKKQARSIRNPKRKNKQQRRKA